MRNRFSATVPGLSKDSQKECSATSVTSLVGGPRQLGYQNLLKKSSLLLLVAAVVITGSNAADAGWIRGKGGVGGGATVDPLIQGVNPIPTISTGQFNDGQKGFFSQADLGNGALRASVYVAGGNGSINANPVYGETITFNNTTGAASAWDFEFSIDGNVEAGSPGFPVEQTFGTNTFRTTFVQFGIHIFEGGTVGPAGSANGWNTQLGNALFSEVKFVDGFPLTGNLENINQYLTDSISGSIDLDLGLNSFDIVAIMSVTGSIPSNINSSFNFDFTNTASLEIDSPIDFVSDSGVFLTGNNNVAAVPEPSTFALLGIGGIALVGYGVRRKRQQAV